ncbi:MAG: Uma2 family endonuclease, partial [Planctomycetota bacterium]
NPDTVRAPDLAFVSQTRVDQVGSVKGYWPGCPDLVAEVVSQHDAYSKVQAKALAWIEAACRIVWIVDPGQKHVTEFRSESSIRIFTAKDRLAVSDVFGDWSIEVGKLFQ